MIVYPRISDGQWTAGYDKDDVPGIWEGNMESLTENFQTVERDHYFHDGNDEYRLTEQQDGSLEWEEIYPATHAITFVRGDVVHVEIEKKSELDAKIRNLGQDAYEAWDEDVFEVVLTQRPISHLTPTCQGYALIDDVYWFMYESNQ